MHIFKKFLNFAVLFLVLMVIGGCSDDEHSPVAPQNVNGVWQLVDDPSYIEYSFLGKNWGADWISTIKVSVLFFWGKPIEYEEGLINGRVDLDVEVLASGEIDSIVIVDSTAPQSLVDASLFAAQGLGDHGDLPSELSGESIVVHLVFMYP